MAIAFTLYHLSLNPDKQARAIKEVQRVLGDKPLSTITVDDLKGLAYTTACLNETLRISCSVPATARQAVQVRCFRAHWLARFVWGNDAPWLSFAG